MSRRATMKPEDAEEYTASLGQIAAGTWRQVAWADRQGIPAALGLTTREWVEDRLGGYVRLSLSDRREAVAELTEQGMTQREVAEVIGIGKTTVHDDLGQNRPVDADAMQVPESGDGPDRPLTPEEIEERQRARDRAEGIARQVNRLRNVLDGWTTISNLSTSALREDVLAALDGTERQTILRIEGIIHA